MTPRAADLEPRNQRKLARAMLDSLNPNEQRLMLEHMATHHPSMLLVCASDFRHEGRLPDGWDGYLQMPPQ
jgi:hypothetical protein